MSGWGYNPHSGGVTVPVRVQERTKQRILDYAQAHYAGKYIRIDVRFRKQFCYIDAYKEPELPENYPPPDFPETRDEMTERLRNTPIHLCRLRYSGDAEHWSMAFYTYSRETYQPCIFRNGTFEGTPEEAFETGAVYL